MLFALHSSETIFVFNPSIQRWSFSPPVFDCTSATRTTYLSPVLPYSEKRHSAFKLERLFKPDLSPSGCSRRLKESQTLGYWSGHLLDCENLFFRST